jgi:hypothetical protein
VCVLFPLVFSSVGKTSVSINYTYINYLLQVSDFRPLSGILIHRCLHCTPLILIKFLCVYFVLLVWYKYIEMDLSKALLDNGAVNTF